MIDVVVPVHEKDFGVLRHSVRSILRHIVPLGRVYVVSKQPFEVHDDRVEWVAEPSPPVFPSLEDVRTRWNGRPERAGWVYQQLLKLGAPEYIPELSPRFLMVDSDVVFLRQVRWDTQARYPYSRATELHPPYEAAYRQLTGREPLAGNSFTAHHVLFDREYLAELLAAIEALHGEPWHQACVAAAAGDESGLNEQDLYGHWVLAMHPAEAEHRQLHWRDVRTVPGPFGRAVIGLDYDFVAAHRYLRQSRLLRVRGTAARIAAEGLAHLPRPMREKISAKR